MKRLKVWGVGKAWNLHTRLNGTVKIGLEQMECLADLFFVPKSKLKGFKE